MSSLKINNGVWWLVFWLIINMLSNAFLQLPLGVESAKAQTSVSWSPPTNLSHSGSASDPSFAIDSNGTVHVLWKDELAGYYYVSGDGLQWHDPLRVEVPFADEAPIMLADENGFIHLFWRGNDEGLYYSYVRASEFTSLSSWAPIVQLAVWSLDFAVTLDASGLIHLVYIRPIETPEFPAGVYYRRVVGYRRELVGAGFAIPIVLFPIATF